VWWAITNNSTKLKMLTTSSRRGSFRVSFDRYYYQQQQFDENVEFDRFLDVESLRLITKIESPKSSHHSGKFVEIPLIEKRQLFLDEHGFDYQSKKLREMSLRAKETEDHQNDTTGSFGERLFREDNPRKHQRRYHD
jgi:hypothetical protein